MGRTCGRHFKAFVEINATAKGMFGNDMGLGPVRYEVDAQAILGIGDVEVSMVVDLSASMTTARMRALGNAMLESRLQRDLDSLALRQVEGQQQGHR